MTKKDVVSAAKELNKVLGLDPQIDTKQDLETLKDLVLQAADLIEPEDEISEKTTKIIEELREEKAAAEPEEEDEGEPEEEDEEEGAEEEESAEAEEEESDEESDEEEESDEIEEEEPVKKGKRKNESKAIKSFGVGVISTIAEIIKQAGKEGITKQEILNELIKKFPDRNAESMKKTINIQVPNRISKEKFPVKKLENGKYTAE